MMDAIESVCTLQFVDRGNDNDDNVELWFYSLDQSNPNGTYGFAYTPGSNSDEGFGGDQLDVIPIRQWKLLRIPSSPLKFLWHHLSARVISCCWS